MKMMTLLKIINARYIDNYKLELTFNDGITGIVDLEDKVFSDHRSVFKPLQDIEVFKNFRQNRWTIEWEHGVDLAPEFLYELILKSKIKAGNLV